MGKILTIVHEDIVENGNQVWNKILILQMIDERDYVLSLDNTSSVGIRISTRVPGNAQSLYLDTVTLLFLRSQDIKEEFENARVSIWKSPSN
jgi:hypothetical protein